MIEWKGEGIILGVRALGENKTIVFLLTEHHGRIAGVMRLTKASRLQGIVQSGNHVTFFYRARLEEHMGTLDLELFRNTLVAFLSVPSKLLAVTTATSMIQEMTPERHPYPFLYHIFLGFLSHLHDSLWIAFYVKLEEKILQEMGFGLKLETCCVTGSRHDLIYVSPKTGRAVSREAGEPYKDKLLKLPSFLLIEKEEAPSREDILDGLKLFEPFLRRHLTEKSYQKIQRGRESLIKILEKNGTL